METVLVTGAAGFLGSHITQHLVESKRAKVVALDDLSGGKKENVPEGVAEFVVSSVTDAMRLEELFDHYKFDYVYHLGAYAAEALSHRLRRFNYINNVIGSATLINEAIKNKVKCFVYTSSIAVYGYGRVPNLETDDLKPIDPYGIGKMAVELDLEAARRIFDLKSIVFRPHNVYGERQNLSDSTRNVVGVFMNRIMHGLPLQIFGDGEQRRAFTYVGDVAPAIAESPWIKEAYNLAINVGSDAPYTINKLANEVRTAMESSDHQTVYVPPRDEARVAISDHSRFRQVFGNYSGTSLHDGLAKMAAWAKSVGPQPSKSPERLEIDP